MKRFFSITAALIFASCLLAGCATTQNLTSSITSKVGSITSNVDDQLFSQVPEDGRLGVPKAESDLNTSEEKLKLANLKEELADAQKEYSEYQADLAGKDHKAAALNLDIAKYEAIDRAGLGDKENNIKNIAKLKTKKHDIEGDRINIEAKISIAERNVSELTEQIKQQESVVADRAISNDEPTEQVPPPPAGENEITADTDADQEIPDEKVMEPTDTEPENLMDDTKAQDVEPTEEKQDQ